jgi:3-hydroxyisobutyrate dehydrogenase-like beta-hydroxyacid dehydrogenase
MSKTVAIFGFGEVGTVMATRLLSQGYSVNVWNRSPEKLALLKAAGVIVHPTEVDNIKSADVIISSLPDSPSLQEVLFHNDWAHELHGRTIIHFGSLNTSRSQAIMDAFHAHQSSYIEVAALGNRDQVASGEWQLFVGAEEQEYEQAKQLLTDLSANVTYIGPVGEAAAIKLALQQLTVSVFCAFSSSISLAKESGVDVDVFMKFLRQSPAYAPMFDNVLAPLMGRDYAQSVTPSKHVEKDLKLFLEQADELGLTTHHVESIRELIGFCVARGLQEMDFTSVHDVINPPKE